MREGGNALHFTDQGLWPPAFARATKFLIRNIELFIGHGDETITKARRSGDFHPAQVAVGAEFACVVLTVPTRTGQHVCVRERTQSGRDFRYHGAKGI
jgi:hypothetical protein